jgi:hypothetical protein
VTNTIEDIRIKLSVLWIARVLTGLQGDVTRYLEPGMLESIIEGTLDIPLTNEMLAGISAMMLLPIFMVFLSLELKHKPNRWLNITVAVFFIIIDGMGFIIVRPLYENIYAVGYVVFCALIVWYAWNWTEKNE